MTKEQLCIGTVKFGMPDYGFSRQPAKQSFDASSFLAHVLAQGVTRFDTAPRYGKSEEVLGAALRGVKEPVWISSKLDALEVGDRQNPLLMEKSVRRSLTRLGIPSLDLVYLHQNELDILQDPTVHEGLVRLKTLGIVQAVGCSVYRYEECAYAVQSGVFDYIQVPVNIFDMGFYDRFIRGNTTSVRFVARSLLLQGLIANRSGITERIKQSEDVCAALAWLDVQAADRNTTPFALALAFTFALPSIDHAILGTTSMTHVDDALRCMEMTITPAQHKELYAYALQVRPWTNPRNWV